jgi:hypothetical protein
MILFELPTDRLRPVLSTQIHVADAVSSPDALTSPSTQAPIALEGGIAFLGMALLTSSESETLDVETWWQAQTVDSAHPISVMAHLMAYEGTVLDTDDGLGIEVSALAPGDVFVQRHRFADVSSLDDLWLRTGIYELDTSERWTIESEVHGDAFFVRLSGE